MKFDASIGRTPMVSAGPNLCLKLEYTNATGSVKDRAALEMILAAEAQQLLHPGSTIIEPTSGNMGISLAALAAKRGYSCVIVMPDSMSLERRQLMVAHGAQLVLTPGALGMNGAVAVARELLGKTPGGWMPGQFDNPANPQAHYRTTGPEIWQQTGGKIDVFVAGVGTGGTITGTARYLKEKNSHIHIVAVEPAASPLLSEGRAGSHGIQGIGANFVPKVLDRTLIDEVVTVTQDDAIAAARHLAGEGMACGISSGAAYHVAGAIACANPHKNVVTILPDSADRYRSIGLLG